MAYLLHPGYFPACTSPREDSVIEGGLAELMAVYWRVRTWELLSFTGTLTFEEGSPWIFDVEEGPFPLGSIRAQEEHDLICGSSGVQGVSLIAFRIPPNPLSAPPGAPDEFGSGEFFLYYDSLSSVRPDGTHQLSFRCSFQVGGGILAASKHKSYLDYLGARIGSVSLLPMGVSADIYGYGNTLGGLSITIRAKEWWSYGGAYDTQTGQRL